MSNYRAAYEAAKNGADWSHVVNQYGDSYDVQRAYEEGRSVYRYSGNSPEAAMGQSFGGLMDILMMAMAAFYIFAILYSPLLLIAFILLYPFFPFEVLKQVGDFWLTYGGLMLGLTYILSCGFEYLRARMLEARFKNRKWRWLFAFIFSFRIIFPGLIVYFGLVMYGLGRQYSGELIFEPFCFYFALFVVLMLLWKVKILNPQSRFYFTGWAFEKGVRSMAHLPVVEIIQPENSGTPEVKISQLKWFYLRWLALTTITGMLLFRIIAYYYPGGLWIHDLPASIFLILSFSSASLVSKALLEKARDVFGVNNVAEEVAVRDWIVLLIGFIASFPMCFDFVKDLSSLGMMLVFGATGSILV